MLSFSWGTYLTALQMHGQSILRSRPSGVNLNDNLNTVPKSETFCHRPYLQKCSALGGYQFTSLTLQNTDCSKSNVLKILEQ